MKMINENHLEKQEIKIYKLTVDSRQSDNQNKLNIKNRANENEKQVM